MGGGQGSESTGGVDATMPAASHRTRAAATSGHSDSLTVRHRGADATGMQIHDVESPCNGPGSQELLVVTPTDPVRHLPHNILLVLPVESGRGTRYGDGMKTLRGLDAANRYNLTIVEPTFGSDPWYADDVTDANHRYETFLTRQLAPWIRANLATTHTEQTWLIGFSKSGFGGQSLILKHPQVFSQAASWDFPAEMSTHDAYEAVGFGTQANFRSRYQLSRSFLAAHREPFMHSNRLWIGGHSVFGDAIEHYDALLTELGIMHTTGPVRRVEHRWDTGWVADALAAMSANGRRAGV